MKNLIFIDNDPEKNSLEDLEEIQTKLEVWIGLPEEITNSIKTVSNFTFLKKNEAFSILFNPQNCILSWSMYTAAHYGSLYQMIGFLSSAGSNEVRDMVYISCSGHLKKALERSVKDMKKGVFELLNAIETNHILTFSEQGKLVRLRVDLKGLYQDHFKEEQVSKKELLNLLNS